MPRWVNWATTRGAPWHSPERMRLRLPRHPIHGLPFDAPIRNELRFEYERMPWSQRAGLLRKVAQRELLLLLTGQTWRRVSRARTRRVLWIYQWGTIGDALMDLAVRRALPDEVRIDLCIVATLGPLFDGDPRFAQVHTRIGDCKGPYDFVLLQNLGAGAVSMKIRSAPLAPFATLFEHLRGERFDRLTFAQRRFEQLFGLPSAAPSPQWLALGPRPQRDTRRTRVAVALGAREPRRWYRRWPEVLNALLARWPAAWPAPEFVLLGNRTALGDLPPFAAEPLARHCRIEVDRLDLPGVARAVHDCDVFLGADGGLMHLAVACDLPGLAVFVEIDPALRLLPGTRLQSLFTEGAIDDLPAEQIALAWLEALRPDGF